MPTSRWVVLFVLVCFVGCGKPPPKPATVTGKVTIDGKTPLPSGEIAFELEKSGKVPTILPITNGQFEGKVLPGKHKVMISSYKDEVVPKGQPGEGTATKANILPDKYHSASTEVRDVTEAGPNNFDFNVTSK